MKEKVSERNSRPKSLSKSHQRNPRNPIKASTKSLFRSPVWLISFLRVLIITFLISLPLVEDLLRIVGFFQPIPKLIRARSARVKGFRSPKITSWRVNLAVIGVSCVILVKLSLLNCQSLWLRWLIFRGFKYKLGYRPRVHQRSEVMF